MKEVFYRMGLNTQEAVALLCGGHVYGRCHTDRSGYAGAWVEENVPDNRAEAVGAQGDHRSVFRRGDTCVEVFRSRITDIDPFNGNVAPRTVKMVGKPYKCK